MKAFKTLLVAAVLLLGASGVAMAQPGYGGGGYGGYGGGYYRPTWHDTSHYHYHRGYLQRHGNHYHYVPGHYHLHRTGHWH